MAVGICEALQKTDYITSTHRGHGHCLAKGASPDRMFAELLGKEAGYCRGKGGSMHIADPATGNLGANAIVCGSAGIATGAALTSKRLENDHVAVCFFGEGALGAGRAVRSDEHGGALEAAGDLRLRKQSLQRVHAFLRNDRGRHSGARHRVWSACGRTSMGRTCALSTTWRRDWWNGRAVEKDHRCWCAIPTATRATMWATSIANITAPSRKSRNGRRSAIPSRILGDWLIAQKISRSREADRESKRKYEKK